MEQAVEIIPRGRQGAFIVYYIFNIVIAYDLAVQGARASVSIVLT